MTLIKIKSSTLTQVYMDLHIQQLKQKMAKTNVFFEIPHFFHINESSRYK